MTESVSAVKLLPLDSAEAIELVAGWLSKYDNYKWLDFGNGVQRLTPVALRVMTQRALHEFRIYTADDGDVPAGMLGPADVGIQRTGARGSKRVDRRDQHPGAARPGAAPFPLHRPAAAVSLYRRPPTGSPLLRPTRDRTSARS